MKAFNQCFLFTKLLIKVINCRCDLLSLKMVKKSQSVFVAFWREHVIFKHVVSTRRVWVL